MHPSGVLIGLPGSEPEPVFSVTAGCVHEHIDTRFVCRRCLEHLRAERGLCVPCDDLGHECVVHVLDVKVGLDPVRDG